MNTGERSLRQVVEKWFSLDPAMPAHVIQFGRMRENRQRFLCVESSPPARAFTLFFFRHEDGSWRVFPPRRQHPAISYSLADSLADSFADSLADISGNQFETHSGARGA